MAHARFVMAVSSLCALSFAAPPALGQDAPRLRPGEPIPPVELEAFVDGVVTAAMAEQHLVGVTVSAVQNGQVVLIKGYGFADLAAGRRVDPERTLFRIGSVTKSFTWIAIMRLVEAGELSLDDPVNEHLPPEVQIPDQGYDAPIRVRDLMTHQSGLDEPWSGPMPERPEELRPLTELAREVRLDRVRPPGEISSYSNVGALLAGLIVEHETGRTWHEVVENEILAPLAMTRTSTREPYPVRADLPAPMPEALAADTSLGYRGRQEQAYQYFTHGAPTAVISSTAADMARYMLMHLRDGELDGARIYGAQTAVAFRTPMTALPPEVGGWAGGFAAFPLLQGGFRSYGHDGGTLIFFSSMRMSPELDFGVFVSVNTIGGEVLGFALFSRVVEHFYGPSVSAPLPGQPDERAEMAEYAGQYRTTLRRYGGLQGFVGRLQAQPVFVSPDGYLTIPFLSSSLRLVPTDEPGRFRNADHGEPGVAVFERRNGRLTALTLTLASERLGSLETPATLFLSAALTALAALAAIVGLRVRVGRGLAKTPLQARAERLQIAAATLWLASLASAGVFAAGAGNAIALMYNWPTPSILAFSTLALLATLASAGVVVLLPAVWMARDGWSGWRKSRFTLTAVVFAAFGALLASWGALQPWNP
jgi:CubicO group peptidase (beta-lactamase class C family)